MGPCTCSAPSIGKGTRVWLKIGFSIVRRTQSLTRRLPENPLVQKKPVGTRKNPGLPADLSVK